MLTSSISSRPFEIIVKTIYLIAEFEVFEQLNQWQIPVPGYTQPLLKKIFLRYDNWNMSIKTYDPIFRSICFEAHANLLFITLFLCKHGKFL